MRLGTTRLRIGIDGHVLGKNIGGVERYVSKVVDLVPDLLPQHDFIVFVTPETRARMEAGRGSNVSFVSLPVSDPLIQRSVVLPWAVRKYGIDILQVQRIAPWACGACKIVLTVHDLTPILYAKDYPGFRNGLVRLLTPSSLRRADLILCPTQTVCNEITHRYPGLRAPCRPFYLGADRTHFARPDDATVRETLHRHAITRPFLYSPGAIEARKNLEVVLQVLAAMDPARRPDLVLSGSIRDRGYFDRLTSQAVELGVSASVRHLGFVPEADLVVFYSTAAMCIAASRDEGFNLMPVEAMSCGTPILCSDIPVHRELFEGGAHFFKLDDADTLARLITRFMNPESERESERAGREACLARLSWDVMAKRMAALFDGLGGVADSAHPSPSLREPAASAVVRTPSASILVKPE